MKTTPDLIDALARAIDQHHKLLNSGSIYIGGGGYPCWYFDPKDKTFWWSKSQRTTTTAADNQIRVETLKDNTITFIDGKLQLRRDPDGRWRWRRGKGKGKKWHDLEG